VLKGEAHVLGPRAIWTLAVNFPVTNCKLPSQIDKHLSMKMRYKRNSSSPSLSRNHYFNDLKSKMADYARNGGKFVI